MQEAEQRQAGSLRHHCGQTAPRRARHARARPKPQLPKPQPQRSNSSEQESEAVQSGNMERTGIEPVTSGLQS